MTLNRWRFKGHKVNPSRLYASEWLRGAKEIVWTVAVGAFIVAGGPGGFKNPVYQALLDAFPSPNLLGWVLIGAGFLALIGTWADRRSLTITALAICFVWHGLLFGYTWPANWGAHVGSSNLVTLYALTASVTYLIQIFVLAERPGDQAIGLHAEPHNDPLGPVHPL